MLKADLMDAVRISTHALTWSATGRRVRLAEGTLHFNSRAHVERDPTAEAVRAVNLISTHALTWSATFREVKIKCRHIHFNSRAHVERDRRGKD